MYRKDVQLQLVALWFVLVGVAFSPPLRAQSQADADAAKNSMNTTKTVAGQAYERVVNTAKPNCETARKASYDWYQANQAKLTAEQKQQYALLTEQADYHQARGGNYLDTGNKEYSKGTTYRLTGDSYYAAGNWIMATYNYTDARNRYGDSFNQYDSSETAYNQSKADWEASMKVAG